MSVPAIKFDALQRVLVTDCGSTTTKALLFEKTDAGWRTTSRGEAPTTVEEPVADVTVGALNAFREIEELRGIELLRHDIGTGSPFVARTDSSGVDLYLSTSSAGGGLQMMVTGVVGDISTQSAERAALGAGAIVMDALSVDDRRKDFERIERIRHIRPDIVLMTGGTDGGTRVHAVEMAEMLLAASPRPRFGDTLKLPIIYAGNRDAAEEVAKIVSRLGQVKIVPNVRPKLDEENLGPAREAIHEFFLSHVMSHSPGYGKLLGWSPVPIVPTPAAVGDMVLSHATAENCNVLCADIGGATTDMFSVFRERDGSPVFNRTVSANLGMSYSVANVLVEAGVERIVRWLPYVMEHSEVRDRLRNKMIRPTTIPQTIEDLYLEQAVCREALRLALIHHRMLAVGIKRAEKRGVADIFAQRAARYELVDMMKLDLAIGSGGVLSHAPNRLQAALMMIDGFGLSGVTELAVDSIFMMPHLGVFASVHPEAAHEIFHADCLVKIGYSVAPIWSRELPAGANVATVEFGSMIAQIRVGEISRVTVPNGDIDLRVTPKGRFVDCGAGPGITVERTIRCGAAGLILDGRNRPIPVAADPAVQAAQQKKVYAVLGLSTV